MTRRTLGLLFILPAVGLFLAFGPKGPRTQTLKLRGLRAGAEVSLVVRDDSGEVLREVQLRAAPDASYAFRAPNARYQLHVDVVYPGEKTLSVDKDVALEGSTVAWTLPEPPP
jgi:hypothetical protein